MHIAEGLLPPLHAAAWAAAALPVVAAGTRRLSRIVRATPGGAATFGAAGGFTLLLSSLKLPSVTGSSSHPTGVGLGVELCGPLVLAPITTIVLLFQALLLGHGGLSTLGANVWAMGIAGPWAMWSVRKIVTGLGGSAGAAVWAGTLAGVLCTYATTAVQLAAAYGGGAGGFVPTFINFAMLFGVTQVPLAIGEATLTMWAVRTLRAGGFQNLSPAARPR